MSFILDALKKSETDRQQQGSAEFTRVPAGSDRPAVPRWLWVLGILLAINLALLLGLFFRPGTETPDIPLASTVESSAKAPDEPDEPDEPSFADRVALAKQTIPARPEPAVVVERDSRQPLSAEPDAATIGTARRPSAILPTIHEVQADGTVELPDLHLDIHVYSDTPEDRFVFINMSKHREASQLSAGPVVEEITPEGVVLEYRGTTFLLPRD